MTAELDASRGRVKPLVWHGPTFSGTWAAECKLTGVYLAWTEEEKIAANTRRAARIMDTFEPDPTMARMREALQDIADPARLTSHGDPGVLRDRARIALQEE